jgi:hypothetical protein
MRSAGDILRPSWFLRRHAHDRLPHLPTHSSTPLTRGTLHRPDRRGQLHLHPETVALWLDRPRVTSRENHPVAPPSSTTSGPRSSACFTIIPTPPSRSSSGCARNGYTGGITIVRQLVSQLRPPVSESLSHPASSCPVNAPRSTGARRLDPVRQDPPTGQLLRDGLWRTAAGFTSSSPSPRHGASSPPTRTPWSTSVVFPPKVMVDNCKTAVLDHPVAAALQPSIRATSIWPSTTASKSRRVPRVSRNRRGAWKSAVGYVKGNFLRGLELSNLDAAQRRRRQWLEPCRQCPPPRRDPAFPSELFAEEIPKLRPLNLGSYDASHPVDAPVNARARVVFDTNRYSVPWHLRLPTRPAQDPPRAHPALFHRDQAHRRAPPLLRPP